MSRWDDMSSKAREAARERNRRWRARHPEEERARNAARHAANRDENNTRSREWHAAHREEANARVRAHAAANPNIHVLYQHGIHPHELSALYEAQGGRCAICNEAAPERGAGCLHIDHDHSTGERRGLICNACNRALPLLEKYGDTWALRALAYLSEPPLRLLRKDRAI